jgi:hypothetical protein
MLLYRFGRLPGRKGTAWVLLGGLMLGASFATEYPTFITVVIAGGLALFAVRPLWRLPAAALAVAVPIGLALLYNQIAFGNPFSPGYAHLASGFAQVHAKGLFGVTTPKPEALWGSFFSISRGLFVYSPWLIAAIVGLFALARRREHRSLFFAVVAAIVGYTYFASSFEYWVGGDSTGPRHLTVLVPLLVFPAAALLERIRTLQWESPRLLLSALFVFSIVLVNFTSMTFSYFHPDFTNPFRDMTLELWREGLFPDSLGTLVGLDGWAALAPYLIGVAILAIFACVAWPQGPPGFGRRAVALAYPCAVAALALLCLLRANPEGRTPWAANETYRYAQDLASPSLEDPAAAAIRRGNLAVLLRRPAEAVRQYLEASRTR